MIPFHPTRALDPSPCDRCCTLIAAGEECYVHEDGYQWCSTCHDGRAEEVEDLMRSQQEEE